MQSIDFRHVNLVDDDAVEALGDFDLIVCRNVLIYFATRARVGSCDRLAARSGSAAPCWSECRESLLRFGSSLELRGARRRASSTDAQRADA